MSTPLTESPVAVIVMAYGTPRTTAEILPYYTDIRRGRPPTDEQLANLTARYDALGGTSGLAARTDAQCAGLQRALDARQPGKFYVSLGLKHATPRIEDTVRSAAAAGFDRAVAVVLAPHFSGMSVGEYLHRASTTADEVGMALVGITAWWDEAAYLDFLAAGVRAQLATLPDNTLVVFTAHSLPERILASGDPYPSQITATGAAVAERVGLRPDQWRTGWQSAGRTADPWLGPDILDVIDDAADRYDGVLVCACGFTSDHLEVRYDLDIEATDRAAARGVAFARTPSMNDDPTVLAALAERIIARAVEVA
jgi:protoporphyrin/coproporphyrin ferrochelatase